MSMTLKSLLNLCPYTHLWRAIKRVVKERALPKSARTGANIALLGLLCPFFWIALFSGASTGELIFHACHSAAVFLIGVIMLLAALIKSSAEAHTGGPMD